MRTKFFKLYILNFNNLMDVEKYQNSDELQICMFKSVGTLIYYVFSTHLSVIIPTVSQHKV